MSICPYWLSFILYNPIRKALTDRKRILDESGITANSRVLEVGAGNGFLTEVIAERARKVYAIEVQEGMVRKLEKRVHHFVDKVEIIHSDIASYSIEEGLFDVCLMYYSFHEVTNKVDAAKNITKALKTDGILSIYEPTIEVQNPDMQKTTVLFESMGFKKEDSRNNFFTKFVRLTKQTK